MTSPRVTTIIVTYNSINTIGECLSGLEQCRREGLTDAIVVDNASTDGTVDFVARQHPWVKLIRPGKNLGFGRGNNLGFEGVETEYAFFLNPDASIGPEALRLLVDFMDKTPAAGVSAPAAMTPKGTGHMSGSFPAPWHILAGAAAGRLSRKKSKWLEPGDKPFQVHWVPGAALLFRSELFRKLGGFDSRFFLYFEETDLLLRAHQAGYEIWAVCEATIHHDGQGSTKQQAVPMFEHCIAQHYFQSRLYYLAKHHGRATAFVVEGGELAFMALRALPELVLKRRVRLFERLKGPVFELPPKP